MKRLVLLLALACEAATTQSTPLTAADVIGPTDTPSALDTTPLPDDAPAPEDARDTTPAPADATSTDTPKPPEPKKTLCVAIRGNGELITAHFAAMARIVETFGPLDGVAGGSSASITAFFTESMHIHPAVKTCAKKACTPVEAGARLGFMYKSLYGYIQAMTERDEAVAVGVLLALVEQAKAQGVGEAVANGKLEQALDALLTLFDSDDVKDIINAEILDLLTESDDPLAYVPMVWAALSTFGAFSADSAEIFLRPGVVSFEGFAEKLGRIGSFYAGYGPVDLPEWEAILAGCALPGRGLPWPEVAALPLGGSGTCGSRFAELLATWRSGFIPQENSAKNRIDEPVGAKLRAMAITSVFLGNAATQWKKAYADFMALGTWAFEPSFADVRAGYWGQSKHTKPVVDNALGFPDLKSQKAMALGPATWRLAISMSPAEPGLSRGKELPDGNISAGGWPDLAPVLALRNAGCDRVIYLTRRGADSKFGRAIAGLAGASAEDDVALYDLGTPTSSISTSLREAAGVWCTDWNAFTLTQLPEIMDDSWTAPLELHDPTLLPLQGDYPTVTTDSLGVDGCTPPPE